MEIHEDYCICVKTWRNLSTDDNLVQKAAHFLIDYINEYLAMKNVSDVCSTLTFKQVLNVSSDQSFFSNLRNFNSGLLLLYFQKLVVQSMIVYVLRKCDNRFLHFRLFIILLITLTCCQPLITSSLHRVETAQLQVFPTF